MEKLSRRVRQAAARVEAEAPVGSLWVVGAFRPQEERALEVIGLLERVGPATFVVSFRRT